MPIWIYREVQGELANNCYVIGDEKSAFVIDPGADGDSLRAAAESHGLVVAAVLLTHFHIDHIGGILPFSDVPTYISEKDHSLLLFPGVIERMSKDYLCESCFSSEKCRKLRNFFAGKNIIRIKEDSYRIPGFSSTVCAISAPGHSPGSICYFLEEENVIFTGDVLFRGGCGRTDLLFSDPDAMAGSLAKLSGMPSDAIVYPGHGAATVIGEEKRCGCLH